MAGVPGLEPGPKVLETSMLTIDTIPLNRIQNNEYRVLNSIFYIRNSLFVLSMHAVAATATAKLFELQPVRRVLFVLCRHVITLFALGTLQNNIISWHKSLSSR